MQRKYSFRSLWSLLKHKLSDPERGSGGFRIFRPSSGINVTHENALQFSAVWACVRIISETISGLSWHVFEAQANGGKVRKNGTLDYLLTVQPNRDMNAQVFRETILSHCLLWGNGYAEIERDLAGRVAGLWPIHPERVEVNRNDAGELYYEVQNSRNAPIEIPDYNMFHLKGLGYDGTQGYSVITMAAKAIGLGMACEEFGSKFFGTGTNPGSVFEIPGKLSQPAYDRLKEDLNDTMSGISNAKKNLILEEGMTHKHLSVPPEDSQFIQTRKLQVEDIARFFRMPLHKLADLTNSSFSNIEQQSIEFVTDTIWPWVSRLEAEANWKFFQKPMRGKTFTKVNLNALMRGDHETRAEFYSTMITLGIMSVNEVRALEDLNPIGQDGDNHYMQMSYTTLDKVGMQPATPVPTTSKNNTGSEDEKED